jgi:ABC-2 type transport system ATP-binding protein
VSMLKITDLRKSYGDRSILKGLNLSIESGEIYGLLGPNGAGKTTTINILCRLLNPDAGAVLVDGRPLRESSNRCIGVAPQENLLYRSLSCGEHLNFFASLYGLPRQGRKAHIQACLSAVGLAERVDSVVDTLSGGMQRRLSLAIALVHRPKLLILDEPTTGLDVEARHELWELIRRFQRQGLAVLLTTHLLDEAERLCHRIGILHQGTILAEGSLEALGRRIPAAELAVIHCEDQQAVLDRAQELGWTHRFYAGELTFWLPRLFSLQQIIEAFAGLPLESVARSPVRLEHIYLEITQHGCSPGRRELPLRSTG